jgi:hypothetical protein
MCDVVCRVLPFVQKLIVFSLRCREAFFGSRSRLLQCLGYPRLQFPARGPTPLCRSTNGIKGTLLGDFCGEWLPPPTGVGGGVLIGQSTTEIFSAEDLPFFPG